MQPRVVIHYPRDGVTYMIGHCGSSSLSSDKDLRNVTCERCKRKIEDAKPS
nr:MAG TPA: TFIIB-TERMINAL DOMAIN, TFIIB, TRANSCRIPTION INITIATION [Caudoviricetes sp.]